MKRFAYTRPDGGVSILLPLIKEKRQDETEAEFIARVCARQIPADAADVTEMEEADIPKDRTFRDAFALNAGRIEVDMPKARTIHMNRIRQARDKELSRLDIEQLKGNDVAAAKQALRDLPQTFDLTVATTPDQLKALWPADLPAWSPGVPVVRAP